MKTPTPIAFALTAVLGLAAVSAFSAPLSEKKQAAIRQEMTLVMQDYLATCNRVDCAAMLTFLADVPEFRFADIDGKQYDYAGFKKSVTDQFAGLSAAKCTTRKQEILVLGPDTALVIWHGAIDLTQKDGSGLRSDPYNVTFLFKRLGGAWKIVAQHESGIAFAPTEAAIRQEVTQVMQEYIAAMEHVDSAAVLRFAADVPEFRYADVDGKQYDYAGFKKLVTELFAGFTAQKATTRKQEIHVLGPDTALGIWHGAGDMIQKDGSVLRCNDYNLTCLFKRLGDAWKVVFQHESGLPPQPADIAAVKQELIKLEDAWAAALRKGDADSIDPILADDYLDTDDTGTITTKAQDLADLKSGASKYTAFVTENYRVNVYGDTAIVTARNTVKGQSNGRDISGQFQFTDTWITRDGRWLCVATHLSKIPQK